MLNRPRKAGSPDDPQPSEAGIEYRQKLENDLLVKVNAQLEPLLGADKYRAAVAVDCDLTSGEQSEETLDPTKSAMLTSQKTEESTGSAQSGGVPGTASNLPRPAPRAAGSSGGMTRRTENVTYQTSRIVRKMRLPQGTVKRVSLSVLLDHSVRFEGQGKARKAVAVPPSPEKIKVLHELLAGVIGFSQERGDQIIIETLPFESTTSNLENLTAPPAVNVPDSRLPKWLAPWLEPKKLMLVLGGAVGAVLLLIGAAFILFRKKKKARATTAAALKSGAAAIAAKKAEETAAQTLALQQKSDDDILNSMRVPVAGSQKADALIRVIRENSQKDSGGIANVVRTWLQEPGGSR